MTHDLDTSKGLATALVPRNVFRTIASKNYSTQSLEFKKERRWSPVDLKADCARVLLCSSWRPEAVVTLDWIQIFPSVKMTFEASQFIPAA